MSLKLCLLGFGNAARAFAKILVDKRTEIVARYHSDVVVVAIVTGSHGAICNQTGIDVARAIADYEASGGFLHHPDYQDITVNWSALDCAERADYDVLLEMTPLNIRTGQPASDHIKAALRRHKHAITANKGPLAWHYQMLRDLAVVNGVCFFYETTVMDGTPIFNLVEHTLKMCQVTAIDGILNTTTNYILEELAGGIAYDDIIARGRQIGFIEADAAMDIEGHDAAAKLTVLLNVLMDAGITPDRVRRKGIEAIRAADIQAAGAKGQVIKLICHGHREKGRVVATVQPTLIPADTLPAVIDGTSSLVQITTDLMGKLSIIEHNPDLVQTGYGLFSDLLRVIERVTS